MAWSQAALKVELMADLRTNKKIKTKKIKKDKNIICKKDKKSKRHMPYQYKNTVKLDIPVGCREG